MNSLQAYKKVHKAAAFLKYGWMINTFLVGASFCLLVYLIWWHWQFDSLGLVTLGFGMWLLTAVALPLLFSRLNVLFAQMALSGANRLIELGVIDGHIRVKLENTKIEHWPDIIASATPNKEFRDKITHYIL